MIVVCVKWVDLRPEIDSLSGVVTTDERRHGFSAADEAALEIGLRLAGERSGDVVLVSVAPPAAEGALRDLAACGAASVVRIARDAELDSSAVGALLAAAVPSEADLVVTGDYSLDRGSGSVPAFLAHHLGWSQALGLIAVGEGRPLTAVRRLDGGRREHVQLDGPAVLAVEGSVARLRRAPMRQVLAARSMPLAVVDTPVPAGLAVVPPAESTGPIRPRARTLPAPSGGAALQRIVELTGALVERTPPRRVEAEPREAAAEIVAQLRSWGYLE